MNLITKNKRLILSLTIIMGFIGCVYKIKVNSKNDIKWESVNSHYPVTIRTYNEDKKTIDIKFNKKPENIVVTHQNSVETLRALGLEEKIVLSTEVEHSINEKYKQKVKKTDYSNKFETDKKNVSDKNVDFILSLYSGIDKKPLEYVKKWREGGINTYIALNSGVSDNKSIENEIDDILNLGKIFNAQEKSREIVDKINCSINENLEKANLENKQSAIIVEYKKNNMYAYGEKTLGADMLKKLGAQVLHPEGGIVSEDELIKLNPDCIFVVYIDSRDFNKGQEEVNKILENPRFENLNAVKYKRINEIALNEIYCSGVKTIDGINKFARGLYY